MVKYPYRYLFTNGPLDEGSKTIYIGVIRLFYAPINYPSWTSESHVLTFYVLMLWLREWRGTTLPPSKPGEEIFCVGGLTFLKFAWVGTVPACHYELLSLNSKICKQLPGLSDLSSEGILQNSENLNVSNKKGS